MVASLCCEDGDDPDAMAQRNQVVANVLAARPGLDFLCVHGIQGAAVGGEYVDEAWVENFEPEVEGAARGVGAIGVRFECETDGAVAPLRGLFPNVSFFGQATEVIAIPPQPVLSMEDPPPGPEGSTKDPADTTLTFLFEFDAPVNQDVEVYYYTDTSGTGETHAKPNDDYTHEPPEQQVTISSGDSSKTVNVEIARDDLYERDETFRLEWRIEPEFPCKSNAPVLRNPVSADAEIQCSDPNDLTTYEKPVRPGTKTLNLDYWKAQPAVGTIEDDDKKPTLTVGSASATEGSAVDFTVGLSDPTGLDVDFSYQTKDGTATQPGDYTAASDSGTIAADETSAPTKTISVPTVQDSVGERDETFELEVTVTNGNATPAKAIGTGTIQDDEPRISFKQDETGSEATSPMQFTVELDKTPTSQVTVDYAEAAPLSPSSAATGGTSCSGGTDYLNPSGRLTFPANTTPSQTIDVVICNDNLFEQNREHFGLQLSNPSSNASIEDGYAQGTITEDDAKPNVSVSASPASVEEGRPMEFKVELDRASQLAIAVDYAVDDVSATYPGDYSIDSPHTTSGTLDFAPGVVEQIITVQALNDTITEADETLTVALTNPKVAALQSGDDVATGTIANYRPNPISIDDVSALEGQDLVFTVAVTRRPGFNQAVTVDYVTADSTATEGDDYTGVSTPTTVTIPGGDDTATITVSSLTDAANEVASETFFVNLTNPTDATKVAINDSTGVGTIQNVISRDLCLKDAATVTEGQSLVFEVILGEYDSVSKTCSEKASTETVTVNWSTRDGASTPGGAKAPGDYVAMSNATLTFNPGEDKKTLSVQTNNDRDYTEPTEMLFVDLGSARNAFIRDPRGEGEITNVAAASISVDDPSIEEGNDLVFTVAVANPPSSGDVTVDYAVSGLTATGPGTATGDDFDMSSPTTATGTLTITAPQTTGTVTLTTESGDAYEPDETVRLDLTNPSANAVLVDATGIGTIEQECVDPADPSHTPPALSFRAGRLSGLAQVLGSADEGVQIPFAVTIDAPFCPGSGGGYFMLRATEVSAASGTDYTAPVATPGYKIGDVSSPTPLDNERQTTVYITTSDDQIDELDETFTLEVNWLDTGANAMPAHYLNNIGWVSTTGTITDNDALPNVTVADAAAGEGSNVVFTVAMDRPSSQSVVLDYATTDDTATAGTDYTRTRSQLTFSPGDTSKTVPVPTTTDTVTETSETFEFELSWPSGQTRNATLPATKAVGTIFDGNLPIITISDVTVREDAGNAVFTVRLSQAASRRESVNYRTVQLTTGDYATSVVDYTATSGTLNFSANATTATISVPIINDTTAEKTEVFQVLLSGASGAVIGDATGVATIIDNDVDCIDVTDTSDSPPTVTVPDASTAESANNLSFTVTLSKPFCADAAFDVGTADGTATAGADYVAWADSSVTVPAYHTQLVWGIQVLADDLAEATEDFSLNIDWASTMPARYRALAGVRATGAITDDDGLLEVSVNDPAKVKEGSAADFVISLDKVSGRAVTVDYATSDCATPNCATAGADYTAASRTATIPAGDISVVVPVLTLSDTAASEADETFRFVLSSPTGAQLNDSTGVGTIENVAESQISVGDATAAEGARMSFTVSLDKAGTAVVSVGYATKDVSATAGSDYGAVSGTLVFSPGDTSKTVTVDTSADGVNEGSETFQLVLSSPANASLADSIGVGTITNVAAPRVRVSDVTVAEGGTLLFEVALDKAAAWDVVVPFTTKDGTAVQPGDYTATANTVTIAAGDTTARVPVVTIDDAIDENDETMRLELSATTDGMLADPIAVGTIFDNESLPLVALTAAKVTVEEADSVGNAGSVSFTVRLSEASGRAVTVDYATDDITATAGSDYTDTDGTLTIAAGSTSGQITVALLNDDDGETAEAFRFTLSNPSNAALGTPATAQAVIIDDDTDEPSVLLRNHTPATEGSPATVEVYLDREINQVVSLYYSTSDCAGDGCATAGTDYTAASNTRITYAQRETSKTISVPTVDDSEAEGDETFTVTLSGATNANLVDQSATLTILDDDGGPGVSVGDASATEGSSLSFTVGLSFAPKGTVTVAYDARTDDTAGDQGAVPGLDFTAASGTLTFNAGDTAKTVTVATVQDVFDEADETFWVQLTSASGATLRDSTAVGTIFDDDPLPSLSVGDASAAEGDSATFTVTLSAASGRDITATYATAEHSTGQHPATSGRDYTAAPGTLRIAAGNTAATVTVSTIDDTEAEQDETFLVKLDNPAYAQIADNTGVGTIIDDDGQSRLSVADVTLFEDEGSAQVAVSLSHASTAEITVGYRTANGTATQPADYTFTSGTLTIAAGHNRGTISVPIVDDSAEENDETFTVELVSPKNATILDQEATATIRDEDGDPRISVGDVTADEDVASGTLDFPVTLSHAADEDITVRYATFDRTATQPDDYTATTGTLTIPAGATTATISVAIVDDNLAEGTPTWTKICLGGVVSLCNQFGLWLDWYVNIGSETLLLRLDSPTGAVIDGGEATGTITDDEDLPRMSVLDAEANEDDGHIEFTVTLTHPSIHTISADWKIRDIQNSCQLLNITPCSAPIDSTPGEVSIAPGATTGTIRVPVYDNSYTSYNPSWPFPYNNALFELRLQYPASNGVLNYYWADAIVWDDETDPYSESLGGTDVSEDAGNAVFTLELNRITDVPVTVSYRTSTASTATAGTDFTAVDSTVTIPAGAKTTTISVPLIDDTTDESSETVVVELYSSSSNQNFALLPTHHDDPSGSVTIIDDDETPELSISDAQASESSEEMAFVVSLDGASDQDITVDYATSDGTGSDAATAPADYTTTSGTLTFAAGAVAASFTVAIEDDDVAESKEQFTVTLSNNSTGSTISDATATGWIHDGDSLPTINIPDIAVNEGFSSTSRDLLFIGYFTEDVNVDISFEFRIVEVPSLGDKAATAGVDFIPIPSNKTLLGDGWYRTNIACSRSASFCARNTGATVFDVELLSDRVPEFDEKFRIDLRNPVNIGLAGAQVWGTLLNDDLPIVTVADVTVSESASSVELVLSLHDEGVEAASVDYRTKVLTTGGHSASPGDDFTHTEGTLDIAVGDTTATITVPLTGDTTDEYDEQFVLELSNASKLEVNDTIAVVTITDDDDGWHITDDSEPEGTTLSFTVTRDDSTSTLTLNYTLQADATNSATGGTHCGAGVDYITPPGTLSFAAGAATGTITIDTCDDTAFEGTEIFLIHLSDVTGRKTTATATITDND